MADAQRSLRELHDPIAVLAFSGWNDAGSAATDAVGHLLDLSGASLVFTMNPNTSTRAK